MDVGALPARPARPPAAAARMAPRATPLTQQILRVFSITIPSYGGTFDVVLDDVFLVFVDLDDVTPPSGRRWRWGHALNALVGCCAPGYSHVEITFLLKARSGRHAGAYIYLAFAVTSYECVSMEVRTYQTGRHQLTRLGVAPAARARLYEACVETLGRPFNAYGLLWNFVVPRALRYDAQGSAFFCSEHVMRMLRDAGISTFGTFAREPHETTPQQLYAYLAETGIFNGVRANVHVSADDLVR